MLGSEAVALNRNGRRDTQLIDYFKLQNGYFKIENPTSGMHVYVDSTVSFDMVPPCKPYHKWTGRSYRRHLSSVATKDFAVAARGYFIRCTYVALMIFNITSSSCTQMKEHEYLASGNSSPVDCPCSSSAVRLLRRLVARTRPCSSRPRRLPCI